MKKTIYTIAAYIAVLFFLNTGRNEEQHIENEIYYKVSEIQNIGVYSGMTGSHFSITTR